MSAPRNIRISHLQSRMIDLNGKGGTELYHHDDLMRELVEALKTVVVLGRVGGTNDRAFIKTALRDCGEIARAALAKIAQEG